MILPLKLIRFATVGALSVVSLLAQTEDLAAIQRKAEAGNAEAQYQLARAYYSGKGMPRDPKQGLQWLRKSATQNYAPAEYALGVMFQLGDQSVSQNPHEAATWFRKAAKQKNLDAQTRLAALLAQGLISRQESDWRASEPDPGPKTLKPPPFSLGEIETGITGGMTSKRLSALITTYGVDFSLNSATRQRLLDQGADDALLATISASKRPM